MACVSAIAPLSADAETVTTDSLSAPLPKPVGEQDFALIKSHSPFLRTVGLSDDLVLTGMAKVEDNFFATLVDTETRVAHLVSETANSLGWQLVGIRGDESDLETMTAKIQVDGGEIVSIRYEKLSPKRSQGGVSGGSRTTSGRLSERDLSEARSAARNYKAGFSSDGFPKEPPREIVEKLSRMSVQQRENLNREMISLRNRGLGIDERRKIYVDKVNQAARGR
jgi:hypothetical protein